MARAAGGDPPPAPPHGGGDRAGRGPPGRAPRPERRRRVPRRGAEPCRAPVGHGRHAAEPAGGRAAREWRLRAGGARSGRSRPARGVGAGPRPRRPGSTAGVLPHPLGHSPQAVRRSPLAERHAARPPLPGGRRGAGAGRPCDADPFRPRRERGARARRAAPLPHRRRRVPPRAGVAGAARLLRRARARRRPAAEDGRVRAFPLPARIAVSPPAGRRVPGHEPRPVGAGLAAGAVVGRRQRAGARRAPAAQRLRGRRPQAVDLPLPGRRRLGARGSGRGGRGVAPGRGGGPARRSAPVDLAQLSRRAGAAGLRQRPVRGGREGTGPARRVPFRRARPLSGRREAGRRRRRPGPGARGRPGRERRGVRRAGGRRDRAAAPGRAGTGPPYRRAPPGRAGRRGRPVPVTTEPPRDRAGPERARDPDLRLQGARLLRRRRDQGRAGVAAVPGRPVVRAAGGGAAAVADRRSVGPRPRAARRRTVRGPAGARRPGRAGPPRR